MGNPNIEYLPDSDNLVAYTTVHIQAGECHICKAETDVLVADPEQSGQSVIPMCQSCVNQLFETLKQGRMDALRQRLAELEADVSRLYKMV